MASVQSVQSSSRAHTMREVAGDDAAIAFDSVMSLAVSASVIDPFIVPAGSGANVQQARLAPLKTGELDSITDLTPSQQAIMKMMSSPPRGQDPLGMMAEVEQDLSTAGSNEAEVQQTGTRAADVRQEVKPEPHRADASGKSNSHKRDEQQQQYAIDVGSVTKGSRSGPEVNPRVSDVGGPSEQAIRAGQGNAMTATSQGLATVVQSSPSASSVVRAVAVGGRSIATGTVTATAVSAVSETTMAVNRLRGRDVLIQAKPAEAGAADAEKVQAQALRGVIAALRKKGDAVTVVLRPESLGKVRVDLRFGASGVHGTLTCSMDSACDLLKQQVDGLQHALEARGIVVERLEVVHDPRIDPDPGAGSAAGWRQDGRSPEQRESTHAGTGHQDQEHAVEVLSSPDDEQAVLIVHNPAFCWDGSRLSLSTLA